MSESAHALTPVPAGKPRPNPAREAPRTFREALTALVGKVVTVVNPESYEEAPVGTHITQGIYRAKVVAVADDYLTIVTEFVHRHGDKEREPVRQFLPLNRIKRVSLMRTERILHL
jgi:hypothetical protein